LLPLKNCNLPYIIPDIMRGSEKPLLFILHIIC
jgi:hypothetical protein